MDQTGWSLLPGTVGSDTNIDEVNSRFYGRFPFPWQAMSFDVPCDPTLYAKLICQDIGDWDHRRVPADARIWVAGCGTNQAVLSALRFPKGQIIGSDVSDESLAIAQAAASALGARNLELRRESILDASYREEFDFVICTGVLHHTADPQRGLERIAAALKTDGAAEVMTYNRFHRNAHLALQDVIRTLLSNDDGTLDPLECARALCLEEGLSKSIDALTTTLRLGPVEMLADALLQPVERSYDVRGFEELCRSAGLELVTPCVNSFDRTSGRYDWTVSFLSPELRSLYERCGPIDRWQIANVLGAEESPGMWFYLDKRDTGTSADRERDMCVDLLGRPVLPAPRDRRCLIRSEDGREYQAINRVDAQPPRRMLAGRFLEHADHRRERVGRVLAALDPDYGWMAVNELRVHLLTTGFPFMLTADGPDPL